MTPRDFCYWMQGFFEINEVSQGNGKIYLDAEQTECVKNHLNMVFHHVDKTFGDEKHQKELSDLHKSFDKLGEIATNC